MPEHGEYGELSVYERTDGNMHTRCVGRERWCEKCQAWITGRGIVSMVMGALCCTRCCTSWEKPKPRPELPEEPRTA